jgi:hypothetical protein
VAGSTSREFSGAQKPVGTVNFVGTDVSLVFSNTLVKKRAGCQVLQTKKKKKKKSTKKKG